MKGSSRAWACVAASAMLILTASQAAAEELRSRSGLYEVTSRLELPHLERWAIDKQTLVCVFGIQQPYRIPLPVLSGNNPFVKCAAANVTFVGGTLQYDIVCPGRDAAKAHATYEFARDTFSGRIAMVMGAKNMTMTEVQRAKRVGDCERDPVLRFGRQTRLGADHRLLVRGSSSRVPAPVERDGGSPRT